MNIFYTPDIDGETYKLSPEESKHCVRVLRAKIGDILHLVDGKGSFFKTEIVEASPKSCVVRCVERIQDFAKLNYDLHIAIAPTKNIDRLEWFLEKCTEIGVSSFTPILCEHSERKVIKPERLEKIIVSAMKQSLKAYKPVLNPLTKFSDFVKNNQDSNKYIAHCNSELDKQLFKNICKTDKSAVVMIGPEGDFSIKEVQLAEQNNFTGISLGESRLRTETAGIVACTTFNIINS
ncbi:MAG: 16S rRNA (uracil(1498)-N(3))-methyltransferase [Marinifilaceae bacterium]|jgi:16S rRNA (uracil1498-N3)-methyltransferase|nr:16S rRNA (uracil(1498)-N(3))-methyltransferase [Marinifilaceae bacterium]